MRKSERDRRKAAGLLAALTRTPDEELGIFVRERLGREVTVDLEHLARVKRMLNRLADTLVDTEPDDVARVRYALDDLEAASPEPLSPHGPAPGARMPGEPVSVPAPAPAPSPVPAPPAAPRPVVPVVRGSSGPLGPSPWAPSAPAQVAAPPPVVAPAPVMASPLDGAPAPRGPLEPVSGFGETKAVTSREHKTLPFKAIDLPPPAPVELEPHPSFGATLPNDRADVPRAPVGAVSLPFDSTPPGADDELHHFARFCAERSVYAEHVDRVRRRYNLRGEEAEKQLRDYWSARFASEPDLRGRWLSLSEHYRGLLLTPRG
ncbi:MAG: hypothetical protein R3B72_48070 [Polyangiaceae bacterium]